MKGNYILSLAGALLVILVCLLATRFQPRTSKVYTVDFGMITMVSDEDPWLVEETREYKCLGLGNHRIWLAETGFMHGDVFYTLNHGDEKFPIRFSSGRFHYSTNDLSVASLPPFLAKTKAKWFECSFKGYLFKVEPGLVSHTEKNILLGTSKFFVQQSRIHVGDDTVKIRSVVINPDMNEPIYLESGSIRYVDKKSKNSVVRSVQWNKTSD